MGCAQEQLEAVTLVSPSWRGCREGPGLCGTEGSTASPDTDKVDLENPDMASKESGSRALVMAGPAPLAVRGLATQPPPTSTLAFSPQETCFLLPDSVWVWSSLLTEIGMRLKEVEPQG